VSDRRFRPDVSVRGERFVRAGTLRRTDGAGSGRFAIARKLGGHDIRPGTTSGPARHPARHDIRPGTYSVS
jgi:hypothetical protein